MSELVNKRDYSRFDHIDTDSDEDANTNDISSSSSVTPTIVSDKPPTIMTKKSKEGRFQFEHEGRLIYEWEQSLEEVNIYLSPPPNIPRQYFSINIQHNHLAVGLKDTPPFLDEDTGGPVKPGESTWTLVDGEINIQLQKMNKAEAWPCALRGRGGAEIDPFTKEEVKKKLML